MLCPVCLGNQLRVLDTRPYSKSEYKIWRRRECQNCLTRMTTLEYIVIDSIPEHVRTKVKKVL